MSYGKHQSFYLKKHWVNKGVKSILSNERVFFSIDQYRNLGIGKNMFQSLRFWLENTGIIEPINREFHQLTFLGELINEYDRECVKNITLNLIHYNMVKSIKKNDVLDSFDWFFNKYDEIIVTKDKVNEDLSLYSKNVVSSRTLDKDIDCLLATYTKSELSHPEDKNISLLSSLGLIKKKGRYYIKTPILKQKISYEAVIYILLELQDCGVDLRIDNIVNHDNGIGKVFNLNRTDAIELIEDMIRNRYPIDITRTNNLDTVRINVDDGAAYLRENFEVSL